MILRGPFYVQTSFFFITGMLPVSVMTHRQSRKVHVLDRIHNPLLHELNVAILHLHIP